MKSLQHIFNGLQLKWKCGRRNKGDQIRNQITKGAYCAATLNWVLLGKVLSTVAYASSGPVLNRSPHPTTPLLRSNPFRLILEPPSITPPNRRTNFNVGRPVDIRKGRLRERQIRIERGREVKNS